jgi:hypothetical protein
MLSQQQSLGLLITVSSGTLAVVRRSIHACETCSGNARVSFEHLLDRLTGRFNHERAYVLNEDLSCPSCRSPIDNDTLLELHCTMSVAARANAYAWQPPVSVQGTKPESYGNIIPSGSNPPSMRDDLKGYLDTVQVAVADVLLPAISLPVATTV